MTTSNTAFTIKPVGQRVSKALILFCLVAIIFFKPSVASASETMEISLQEAYELALEHNHDIRSAKEGVEQGRLLQKQAITVLFPKLTGIAGYSTLTYPDNTTSDGTSWGLNLSQTVYNGGRVWIAKKGAEYTMSAAEAGLEFARQSILLDLIVRSNQLLSARDLLTVSEKRVSRVLEQLRYAEARLEVGDVPRTSVLSAKVQLSTAELGKVEAQKLVALSKTRLKDLIGSGQTVSADMAGEITTAKDASLEELTATALDKRADLEQGRELVKIAEQQAKLVSRDGYPDLDITGSYTNYSDENPSVPETQAAITLTWPFFQGGLVGLQTKEAFSKARQAEESYGSQVDAVKLEIEEAYLTLKTLQTQEELVITNLTNAQENHRLARTRFELGEAVGLDVLDAEEDLAEAENLAVNHRYDTRMARAALLYSVGILDIEVFEPKSSTGGTAQ